MSLSSTSSTSSRPLLAVVRRPAPCEHLFLTGNPGVGKTTVVVETVKAILREASSSSALQEDDRDVGVNVRVRGFYTEERRCSNGDRIGFDIVHVVPPAGVRPTERPTKKESLGDDNDGSPPGSGLDLDSIVKRTPLSRIGAKGSGRPMVGKYVVDVDGVEKAAVPSIDPDHDDDGDDGHGSNDDGGGGGGGGGVDLVLLDEVGKMEMLCPTFLPAVQRALDCGGGDDTSGRNRKRKRRRRIVLGTIPTPRYGRVIQAVEEIRARPDVTIVYVTKANRDEVRVAVEGAVLAALGLRGQEGGEGDSDGNDAGGTMADLLRPYLYSRDIGAPSMNGKPPPPGAKTSGGQTRSSTAAPPPSALLGPRMLSRKQQEQQQQQQQQQPEVPSTLAQAQPLKPCGPLVHATVEPAVLLLGETASAQPAEVGMEYSERSMWIVLAQILWERPVVQADSPTDYLELREKALSTGIAIWDVLSDVHIPASNKGRGGKRPKKDANAGNANDIVGLLRERPSIRAIAFIGAKARKTFGKHFTTKNDELMLPGGSVRLIVLPSSSRANSRMSASDKSKAWVEALSGFCPTLKGKRIDEG